MPAELPGYLANIFHGAWITLAVALVSLALSLAIGVTVAPLRLSPNPLLRAPVTLYTTLFRGVPDLVLMFLLFYGGQDVANNITDHFQLDYFEINPFIAGCVTLGLIFGAYMAETFRGAILAIPHGQIEAAQAFGLSKRHIFRRIVFPQMLRNALPGLGNNWLVLLKTTALVSIIGLSDMVFRADLAAKKTMPFFFYMVVALIFLVFTSISVLVLRRLKRRFNRGFAVREG
ncbi:ABC transporter permease [Uliginosibacterium sp. sgz301328]|uniref:ABC transporter permease n=1 Tax=Uliginosibacterium sp. sgz301328 TaxID=3243764 RepID=UPI00359EA1FC